MQVLLVDVELKKSGKSLGKQHYTMGCLSFVVSTWLRSRSPPLFAQFDLYLGVVDDATVSEHFKKLGWILRTPEVVLKR